MSGTVLVVGASGLIGSAAVDKFLADGWDVLAMSRRPPEYRGERSVTHLSTDLMDADAVRATVNASMREVTHVVYAAVYEKPGLVAGWTDPEQMATNLAMLAHLIEPLAALGNLQHVAILQGTKAYGVHLHPIPIPARERYPRDDHQNFYWLQEDFLVEQATRYGFSWTIFRPTVVLGPSYGVAMNVLPVIGAFAAVARETGIPFGYPGHIPYPREAVDVRLIAEAAAWAAVTPSAANQHFNLTNGEVFSWRDLWPRMARVLGVEWAEDRPLSMATFLPEQEATWERIVGRYRLRPLTLAAILGESHHYADFCFGYGLTTVPPPAFVSTVKIKEAGFTRVMDTEHCVEHWLNLMVERRVLPPC